MYVGLRSLTKKGTLSTYNYAYSVDHGATWVKIPLQSSNGYDVFGWNSGAVSSDFLRVSTPARPAVGVVNLYRSTNGLLSWSQIDPTIGTGCQWAMDMDRSGNIWVAQRKKTTNPLTNTFYVSSDAGMTLSPVNAPLPCDGNANTNYGFRPCLSGDGNVLYASIQVLPGIAPPNGFFVFRSDDLGATWSPLPLTVSSGNPIGFVSCSDDGESVVVVQNSNLTSGANAWYSLDGGATFSQYIFSEQAGGGAIRFNQAWVSGDGKRWFFGGQYNLYGRCWLAEGLPGEEAPVIQTPVTVQYSSATTFMSRDGTDFMCSFENVSNTQGDALHIANEPIIPSFVPQFAGVI